MNYAGSIAVIRISAENVIMIYATVVRENLKKVDFSTSFEKDYKHPKPEDSIEGGLYGKIEL